MFSLFGRRSLDGILRTFDSIKADLEGHVSNKSQEHLELLATKSDIEDKIDATASEVDRTHRVLAKLEELIA